MIANQKTYKRIKSYDLKIKKEKEKKGINKQIKQAFYVGWK